MFGISLPELCIIFGVALIVLGPERLPEVARSLGKTTATLRRMSNDIRKEIYNSVYPPIDEAKLSIGKISKELRTVSNINPLREIKDSMSEEPRDETKVEEKKV